MTYAAAVTPILMGLMPVIVPAIVSAAHAISNSRRRRAGTRIAATVPVRA